MSNPVHAMSDGVKHFFDAFSIGWLVAVILANLPAVTAGLSAVWVIMRIYESAQNIRLNNRKLKEGERD